MPVSKEYTLGKQWNHDYKSLYPCQRSIRWANSGTITTGPCACTEEENFGQTVEPLLLYLCQSRTPWTNSGSTTTLPVSKKNTLDKPWKHHYSTCAKGVHVHSVRAALAVAPAVLGGPEHAVGGVGQGARQALTTVQQGEHQVALGRRHV